MKSMIEIAEVLARNEKEIATTKDDNYQEGYSDGYKVGYKKAVEDVYREMRARSNRKEVIK